MEIEEIKTTTPTEQKRLLIKAEPDMVKAEAPIELNEENDINSAINKSINENQTNNPPENKLQEKEITELRNQMKDLQKKVVDMSNNKDKVIYQKIDDLNKSKMESVKLDQQFVKELKSIKLSVKSLNNTEIFPHFLNSSRFKDLNFVYFKLIDSLCKSRYFKSILSFNKAARKLYATTTVTIHQTWLIINASKTAQCL